MGDVERVRAMLREVGVTVADEDLARVADACAMLDGFAARLRAVDVGDAPPATRFSVRED